MSRYKLKDIADIVTGPFGSALHQNEYVSSGTAVIMPQDIGDRTLSYDKIAYITKEKTEELSRYIVQENDIVYARRGDVEKHAFITASDVGAVCGTGCLRVRINSETVNPVYVSFYLNRPETRKWIVSHAVGSNMSNINSDILGNVPLELPDIEEQNRIATFLQNLDQVINNNNKMNEELNAFLNEIYEYWFIQFDFPDENGNPYKTSGGNMVWNDELNMNIPEGWQVGSIINNDISTPIKSGIEYFDSKNYLPTANVVNDSITDGEWVSFESRESRANMQPALNSVWFAKMKNSIKHISIPNNANWFVDKYVLSTGFQGIQCNESSFGYIHCIVNSGYFELRKDTVAHGATQESVNDSDLDHIKFVIPPVSILSAFNNWVSPFLKRKFESVSDNQQLLELRDFLNPLLMNGQVRIKTNK